MRADIKTKQKYTNKNIELMNSKSTQAPFPLQSLCSFYTLAF